MQRCRAQSQLTSTAQLLHLELRTLQRKQADNGSLLRIVSPGNLRSHTHKVALAGLPKLTRTKTMKAAMLGWSGKEKA